MWRRCLSIQIGIYTSNSCPTDRPRLYQIDFHICRKSRRWHPSIPTWRTWHLFGVAPLILFGPQNAVGGLQKWQQGTQNTVDELQKVDRVMEQCQHAQGISRLDKFHLMRGLHILPFGLIRSVSWQTELQNGGIPLQPPILHRLAWSSQALEMQRCVFTRTVVFG